MFGELMERPMTTMTSRQFNHDTARAKRAALSGPVIITDRGKPSFVLMTVDEYMRLASLGPSIADVLGVSTEAADIDIDFDVLRDRTPPRVIEFD